MPLERLGIDRIVTTQKHFYNVLIMSPNSVCLIAPWSGFYRREYDSMGEVARESHHRSYVWQVSDTGKIFYWYLL